MKKLLVILVLVVAGSTVYASPARLVDVELSSNSGLAVATIHVDGVVRFKHETVEAKDGKPFRVLVDLLQAEHHLTQKDFAVLPKCVIQQIRTSQYSVTPEKVVRIVFDLSAETVYRADSDNSTVTLYFTDKNVDRFDHWRASKAASPRKKPSRSEAIQPKVASVGSSAPSKSVSTINEAIEKDRQLSLAGKTKPESSPVTSVKISKPRINTTGEPYGPEYDPKWTEAETPQPESGSENSTNVADTKVELAARKSPTEATTKRTPKKSESVKKTTETQPAVAKAEQPAPAKKPAPEVVAKAEKPAPTRKDAPKVVAKAEQPAPAKKAAPKVVAETEKPASTKKAAPKVVAKTEKPAPTKKPAAKQVQVAEQQPVPKTDSKVTVAAVNSDAPEKSQTPSTSRFRRRATGDNKIKGTMVAEFPKRLVIKYRAKSHRDPFETLINEGRTHDNPIERQVPNVEGLKLVGIIEGDGGDNSALFEDDNNTGYILKAGDKVQKGYVLRVESNRVYFQIFEYGWSRTVALRIDG